MATFMEALEQKNKLSPVLLQRPDVRGVGVGYAYPDKPNLGAAVIVYTGKSSAPEDLGHIVTTLSTSTFPIRYISSGVFKPTPVKPKLKHKLKSSFNRSQVRPVPAGVSIGVPSHGTGTAGLIVTKNKRLYLLTNHHILVRKHSAVAAELIQPGPADGGKSGRERIGWAYQYVPLKTKGPNYMDAAIAKPALDRNVVPQYLAASGRLTSVPGHLQRFRVGERFVKSGRTTGWISGVVESVNVDVRVRYEGVGRIWFRNQAVIVGQTGAGDSGSVWLRQSDRYAAALHFAGDGLRSISSPMGSVMDAFGLRVAVPLKSGGFKPGVVKKGARLARGASVQPLTRGQKKRARAIFARK